MEKRNKDNVCSPTYVVKFLFCALLALASCFCFLHFYLFFLADDRTSLSPLLASGISTESQNLLTVFDGHSEFDITSPVDSEVTVAHIVTEEQQQQQTVSSAPSVPSTGSTSMPSVATAFKRQRSLNKIEAPPAAIVRRSEVSEDNSLDIDYKFHSLASAFILQPSFETYFLLIFVGS